MSKATKQSRADVLREEMEECTDTASVVAFRGQKQLFMCGAHVGAYTGKGMVANYRTPPIEPKDKSELQRNGMKLYTGPARTCGEEAEGRSKRAPK